MWESEELWENSSKETLLAWTGQTRWGRQREASYTDTHPEQNPNQDTDTQQQVRHAENMPTTAHAPYLACIGVGVGEEPGVCLRKCWKLPSLALNLDKLLGSQGCSRLTVPDLRVVTPLELNHLFMGEGVTQDRQKIQIFT